MSYVVAIGGGEIERGETRAADELILDLTGKSVPNVLFLPTASEDDPAYVDKFRDYYTSLGAVVTVLEVASGETSPNEIEDKVGAANAFYGGGGRFLTLKDAWELSGLDAQLIGRVDDDVVFGGQSAGANCWFSYASSDSKRPGDPQEPKHTVINGLAIVRNTLFSPHFSTERDEREPALIAQLESRPDIARGVSADDCAAYVAELVGGEVMDEYAVSTSSDVGSRVYTRTEEGVLWRPLPVDLSYTPIS